MFLTYAEESTLDYTEEFDNLLLSLHNLETDNLIDEACAEMMVLVDAYKSKELVLEKVEVGANNKAPTQKQIDTTGGKIADYFRRIVKFIQGLVSKFMDNVTSTFDDEYDWFKKNSQYITKMPDAVKKDIKISAADYSTGVKRLSEVVPTGFTDFAIQALKKMQTDPNLGKIQKLDDVQYIIDKLLVDNNIKSILKSKHGVAKDTKTFFLGEENGAIPVKDYKNDGAVDMIKHMSEFIGNYRNLVNSVKEKCDAFEKAVETAAKAFESGTAVKASNEAFQASLYSIMEESSIFKPGVFNTGTEVKFVRENEALQVDGGTTDTTKSVQQEKKTDVEKKTKAEVQKQGDQPTNQANPQDQSANLEFENKSKIAKKMMEIASGYTSGVMSAMQTIKDHYMSVLKQVVDAIKKYQGIKEEDKKNKAFNKNKAKAERDARIADADKNGNIWDRITARL